VFKSLDAPIIEVKNVEEFIGKGVQGFIEKPLAINISAINVGAINIVEVSNLADVRTNPTLLIQLGSADFVETPKSQMSLRGTKQPNPTSPAGSVFVKINGQIRGYFQIKSSYREGFGALLDYCKSNRKEAFLLSGDNDRERVFLSEFFKPNNLLFRQTPLEKLNFVKKTQQNTHKVLMIGDGLNDAGALQQSDVGIVISENTNNFSPACDAILAATRFADLPKFLALAKAGSRIVGRAYLIALCYNIVGLSYAVTGNLQPVIAAILMPVSSVTIVLFGVLSGNLAAKRLGIDSHD
jgi:cation transport ATPase